MLGFIYNAQTPFVAQKMSNERFLAKSVKYRHFLDLYDVIGQNYVTFRF